ncbi:MAG TPA: ABC transporter ATP-binding protein [Steroidobacteraceae bacterium]
MWLLLWRQLGARRRRQVVLLLGLMVLSAFAEVVSLGAVLPLLGILTAPERVFAVPAVGRIAQQFGMTSAQQLVLPITVAFSVAALAAGAIRMLLLWVSTRLAFAIGADFSIDVYRRTLYQPYRVHVLRNSSEVISGITHKVANVVEVLYQSLMMVSSMVLLVSIVAALLFIDPVIASVATLSFGLGYGAIAWLSRSRLHRNSKRIADEQTRVIKALQEGLGGIRDVLLDGSQEVYCDIYRQADAPLRRAQGNNLFIAGSPRFAMETLGMILIAILAYGLSGRPGGLATALPVLGALAFGAQRLLPVLQQSYTSWAAIAGRRTSVVDTIELLNQPMPDQGTAAVGAPLAFGDSIEYRTVSFRYAPTGPWVLNDVNLTIRKGARIGLVGTTGSGKSTLLDLLMGLLEPTQGQLLVDGVPLQGGRVAAWQKIIAHVPQSIFLTDATLAENIAFGVPPADIDMENVRRAARQAQIADFAEELPDKYATSVGERGVRLSGGQRQRIGIARALYKHASVLVFDEATSALDSATERSVMEAIQELDRELTVLLIAHRLTTVRRCDVIVELRHGALVAQGSYDELLASSASFREMALAAH